MIKNIVFDFDGTIADSTEGVLKFVNDNHQKYGFKKLSEKKVNFLKSKGSKYVINYLKIPKHKIPFLLKDVRIELGKVLENTRPYKGISVIIKKLYTNFKLGILTSNSKENVEKFLVKNKLEYFDFIYHGSSLFGKDKMLKKMFREKKLIKNETIYVGDEDRDIKAAKKVSIKSAAVTWGFNSRKLLQSTKPDFLIDKPSNLLQVIN